MAVRLIGVAGGDQPRDHVDHLRHVLGGARLDIGRERAQRRHVLVERLGGALGHRADALARSLGRGVDLVVDVGDVADIAHMRGAVEIAQQPVEHIEDNDGPRIADMREVIDRRPADIHADILRVQGLEGFLAAGQRVVQDERH